ncbi:hypothetical protein QWZ10_09410 [Paracoccus cavernae]|uniref:Precorrin-3B C(17)-methyltransferase n=1 Tax=Paracoccus cavernae TaxID=1571207 RepID=A0ABT8D635_9RHOB|nr:hypothetical protein [Paracoccus cavernae]
MSGTLTILGTGPGAEGLIVPEADAALAQATDALGYIPICAALRPARV